MCYLPLILKNSVRNRRRSVLTIASLAVSLCLLGVVGALYTVLYIHDPAPAQARRLVTRNRVSLTQPLPLFYRDKIRQVLGVQAITVSQWFGGIYKDSRHFHNFFARFGVEPGVFFTIYPEYTMPEDQKQAWVQERRACIVGKDLVTRFGWHLGDHITLQGNIFPVDLELVIRGIYNAPEENESLFFHIEYLYEALPASRRDTAGAFTILAAAPEAVPQIAPAIDELFRNATAQTRTETERAFALSYVSFIGNVKRFLLVICSAVTFTILLVSANTMSMSVRERIKEVGVLKTLGFTREAILGIILGESACIALAGGLIGLLLANGVCYVVRQGPSFIQQTKALTLQPGTAGACLLLAVLIGTVSALVPAWQASRTTIVDALKDLG
jgi:putative ABC transport system permease protein